MLLCYYLWSSGSADHLQQVGLAVLLAGACHILRGRLDHHQMSRQVHPHGQSPGGNWGMKDHEHEDYLYCYMEMLSFDLYCVS